MRRIFRFRVIFRSFFRLPFIFLLFLSLYFLIVFVVNNFNRFLVPVLDIIRSRKSLLVSFACEIQAKDKTFRYFNSNIAGHGRIL